MRHPANKNAVVGPINGLNASTLHLPAGSWPTLLDALCARFPTVTREQWQSRFERGRVLDMTGVALRADHVPNGDLRLRYYREVASEIVIPFAETLIHVDADLLIADKPHFLPVTPSGPHVEETLLARLIRSFDQPDLVPLHRIDAATAGLVAFSCNPATRGAYQGLFREHRIEKTYEAVAPPLPQHDFPFTRRSRIVKGEPFFLMTEAEGAANSETLVDVIERGSSYWRYLLSPVSGRQHQLRVHMAALGAPLRNDDFYPRLDKRVDGDYTRPLQLLAKTLEFVDPQNGSRRRFDSRRSLLEFDDA